jgi:hypothetical protein
MLMPFMVMVLAGTVDFGLLLIHRMILTHAVSEGAHYGTVHHVCEEIQAKTADLAGSTIPDSGVVGVSYEADPAPAGTMVRVAAPFDWEFPLLSRFGVAAIHASVAGEAMLDVGVSDAGGCGPQP